MIIHFTSSRSNESEGFETLKRVIDVIHKTGNLLARDWVGSQFHTEITKPVRELEPGLIYDLSMDAIERSDMVIIESSLKSFGSGFQAAIALQKKKPTLLLIKHSQSDNESLIEKGINDPLFVRKKYVSDDELERIVVGFIEENTYKTKDLRFNFVLDPQLYNHIRWKSFKTKKTKAEIVRELLIRDMEQS
jgi:hypothetical protein